MEEKKESTAEKNKEKVKVKQVSKYSKILGVSMLAVGFVLDSLGIIDCDIDDLIKVSLAIVAMCATVDINIALDKFIKK